MIYIVLGAVGLLSGVTAALGIGGGFVLLLYLTTIANMPQREAQLLNLIFFIPIGIMSVFLHFRNKLIVKEVLLKSIIGGIIGVFAGVFIGTMLSNEFMGKAFAVFVLIIGIKELFAKNKSKEHTEVNLPQRKN